MSSHQRWTPGSQEPAPGARRRAVLHLFSVAISQPIMYFKGETQSDFTETKTIVIGPMQQTAIDIDVILFTLLTLTCPQESYL